jgi:exosortase
MLLFSGSGRVTNVLGIFYILSIAVFAFYPVFPTLIEQWFTHQEYDYCLIVALLGMGVLFYRINGVLDEKIQPSLIFFIPLVFVCLLLCVMWMGRSEIGAQILVPPVLWLSLAAFCGMSVARQFIAPIAFLYFAIPIWDQLLPVLQKIAILGSVYGMKALAVPVVITENRISIPEGTFQVLYECSGLRYMIAGMALTSFISMVDQLDKKLFIKLLLATIFLAMGFNLLRIIIVMYAGHVTGMRHYFVSNNHKWLGELLFIFLLIIIIFIESKYKKRIAQSLSLNSESSSKEVITSISNAGDKKIYEKGLISLLMATIVFLVFNLYLISLWKPNESNKAPQLGSLPTLVESWQGPFKVRSEWKPEFFGAVEERFISYSAQGREIDVYMNIYGHQLQGKELVFDGNKILGQGRWQIVGYSLVDQLQSVIGRKAYIRTFRDSEGMHWAVSYTHLTLPTSP